MNFRLHKKKSDIMISFAFLTAILLLLLNEYVFSSSPTTMRETLLFFPEDHDVSFLDYSTEIQLLELEDENEYILQWQHHSTLNKPVYLRQDFSLLYENGMLADIQSIMKKNETKIKNMAYYYGEDSGKHEAITIHYAEVHYPDEIIKSKRTMSYDRLYIIDSPLSPIITFKNAKTTMEERSKELLDSIVEQQLTYVWEGLMEEYNINKKDYIHIPLNAVATFTMEPLPSFTQEKTNEVIGKLWEGLYRHYILGINTFNDTDYDPIGSTMPLILLQKEGRHLIVLYETADHVKQQLFQLID